MDILLVGSPLDTVVRLPVEKSCTQSLKSMRKKVADFMSSKTLFIQTLFILIILVVPSNVVTFIVMHRIKNSDQAG